MHVAHLDAPGPRGDAAKRLVLVGHDARIARHEAQLASRAAKDVHAVAGSARWHPAERTAFWPWKSIVAYAAGEMGRDTSNPRLDGARHVRFRLTNPRHAELARNVEKVEKAWARARQLLASAGGLCHCGNRWGHLMDGVEVMLLDRAPYTARCWDDDRVWINLPLFGEEPDGGAEALVHEFGHRVWFQCLSPEQQDEWTKSWNEAKRRPAPRWTECSGTITGYACTNDLEDFAEVFQAVVLGRVDDYNWKRWVAVCGCGEGGSCARPTRRMERPSGEQPTHGDMRGGTIRWKMIPGGAAEISRTPGGGPYAKSEDSRFIIWVSRYLPRGGRSYSYHFSAVDYGIPSGGHRFSKVPIGTPGGWQSDASTNVKLVKAAVERWAQSHVAMVAPARS